MKWIFRGISQLMAVVILAVASQGCSKESVPSSAPTSSADKLIGFTPYTPIMTSKAVEVDNTSIQDHGFNVGAYIANSTDLYIPCTHLTYDSESKVWRYVDDDGNYINRYWPSNSNTHLTFLAHYPKGNEEDLISSDGDTYLFGNERYEAFTDTDDDLAFKFGYTVANSPDDQFDLIYALREDVESPQSAPYSVELPFCHALTQVAFTAQLDTDLGVDMTVYQVVLHNLVYSGTFAVKDDTSTAGNNGVWWYASSTAEDAVTDSNDLLISQFGSDIDSDGVKLPDDGSKIELSNTENVMMLMPQHISPWVVETFESDDPTKAGAYLAISCEITQEVDGEHITIHKKEKWLYVPLTTDITYPDGALGNGGGAADSNEWVAGYKITYNLCFGGGYSTVPGASYPVKTLSEMVITATADKWEDGGDVELQY